jgi:hypothetical protein
VPIRVSLVRTFSNASSGGGVDYLLNPSAYGYPDATNTGYTTTLTPIDMNGADYDIEDDDAVVEDIDLIDGTFAVYANNVTIRNCRVTTPNNWIQVWTAPGITGLIVEDCEFDGASACGIGPGVCPGAIVRRCNIHDVENGLSLGAGQNNVLVRDNYIHDLTGPVSPEPHFDGIQMEGDISGLQVIHNTFSIPDDTGAVNIANNSGPTDDILVDDNLMEGGTYTVYVDDQFGPDPITNVTVSNNRFGWHTFGHWLIRTPNPTIVFTNNVDDATGDLLPEEP